MPITSRQVGINSIRGNKRSTNITFQICL